MISVVIPVYNAEKYLNACLDSILTQDFEDYEIVCINDGSKDHSLDILQTYQAQYPDKIVVKSIPNGGQANARNTGIELSKGDYIVFVDSDDDMKPNALRKLYDVMSKNKSDMVVCEIDRIFTQKKSIFDGFSFDTSLHIEGSTSIKDHPEIIPYITAAPYAKLISKDFLIRNDIQFIKGKIYEDLVFTQNILSCDPKITFLNEKLYNYYVRANSTMTSKNSKVQDMFFDYDMLYSYYKEKGLEKTYKDELEFLCLYHVLIGTSFRLWRSNQMGLFQSISTCRKFVRKYHFSRSNKYLKKKGFISVLFVKIFA